MWRVLVFVAIANALDAQVFGCVNSSVASDLALGLSLFSN